MDGNVKENKNANHKVDELHIIWQGWRDSNPRPSVLETDALTD